MNLSDKVYYVEFQFDCDKYNVKESTVGKVFRKFKHPKKEVFENYKRSKDKRFFKLILFFSSGYLEMQKFYFNRNDAIKEILNNLDNQISRAKSELSSLEDARIEWIIQMS